MPTQHSTFDIPVKILEGWFCWVKVNLFSTCLQHTPWHPNFHIRSTHDPNPFGQPESTSWNEFAVGLRILFVIPLMPFPERYLVFQTGFRVYAKAYSPGRDAHALHCYKIRFFDSYPSYSRFLSSFVSTISYNVWKHGCYFQPSRFLPNPYPHSVPCIWKRNFGRRHDVDSVFVVTIWKPSLSWTQFHISY